MKLCLKILVLSLLFCVLNISTFGQSVEGIPAKFDTVVNGVQIAGQTSTYPVVVYDENVYLPMTEEMTELLGLKVTYDEENKVVHIKNITPEFKLINKRVNEIQSPKDVLNAELVVAEVTIDSEKIMSIGEVLIVDDCIYLPLNKILKDALGWTESFEKNQLKIVVGDAKTEEILLMPDAISNPLNYYKDDKFIRLIYNFDGSHTIEISEEGENWEKVGSFPETFGMQYRIYKAGDSYIIYPNECLGYEDDSALNTIYTGDIKYGRTVDVIGSKDLSDWQLLSGKFLGEGKIGKYGNVKHTITNNDEKLLLMNLHNVYMIDEDFNIKTLNYTLKDSFVDSRFKKIGVSTLIYGPFVYNNQLYKYKDYYYVMSYFGEEESHRSYKHDYELVTSKPRNIIMRSKDGYNWESIKKIDLDNRYFGSGRNYTIFEEDGLLCILTDNFFITSEDGLNWEEQDGAFLQSQLVDMFEVERDEYDKSTYDYNGTLKMVPELYADIKKVYRFNGYYIYLDYTPSMTQESPNHSPSFTRKDIRLIITKDFKNKMIIDGLAELTGYYLPEVDLEIIGQYDNILRTNFMAIDFDKVNQYFK